MERGKSLINIVSLCLPKPFEPQYNGGILVNSELNEGIKGWSAFGNAKVEHRESFGNKYIVALAHSRNRLNDSVSQEVYLQKDRLYTFSAWIQVSHGEAQVVAVFNTSTGLKPAGAIIAEANCWSMLKGGITVNVSSPAQLYFESKNTSVEIWIDNISLQPFTEEEWTSHQNESIEKERKSNVMIKAVDKQGNPIQNATISFVQNRLGYPFGWVTIEANRGKEDYSEADAMLRFTSQHGVSVRGHNIIWDDPQYQPGWVHSLSNADLSKAVNKRIFSIVKRYRGKVIAWDVVNENLHTNFYESKLGQAASSNIFKSVRRLDKSATLFMNEYNTIEDSSDPAATPPKYLQKLRQIQKLSGIYNIGIGLEAHFKTLNLPYMRSGIDILGATKLPIWLTEVDVFQSQPGDLDQVLREGHAHPQVKGIIMWAGWTPSGCNRMCLTYNNFRNLPTGNVVDNLLRGWGALGTVTSGKTDANGLYEMPLFHGEYEVKISHPTIIEKSSSSSMVKYLNVTSTQEESNKPLTLLFQI
ncbi:hypothetical protein ACFE04_031849 [Oxalis oulophora]